MATAAVTGAIALYSVNQQRQARKESKKAVAIERRAAEVQNLRERKKALAARQRAAAQAAVAGEQAGVGATSGVVLAEQASLGSQFGSNIGFAQELTALNAKRLNALDRANADLSRAGTAEAFGQAITTVSGAYQQAKAAQLAALKKGAQPDGQ